MSKQPTKRLALAALILILLLLVLLSSVLVSDCVFRFGEEEPDASIDISNPEEETKPAETSPSETKPQEPQQEETAPSGGEGTALPTGSGSSANQGVTGVHIGGGIYVGVWYNGKFYPTGGWVDGVFYPDGIWIKGVWYPEYIVVDGVPQPAGSWSDWEWHPGEYGLPLYTDDYEQKEWDDWGGSSWNPSFTAYDSKVTWGSNTSVEIFSLSYDEQGGISVQSSNGDKLVAPGTENSYTFTLANTGNTNIYYMMSMSSNITYTNKATGDVYKIPMETRLSNGSSYILGSADAWLSLEELNQVKEDGYLGAGNYTKYTLDWRWPFEGDDAYDTLLGDLAAAAAPGEELVVSIGINVYGEEYHEPSEGSDRSEKKENKEEEDLFDRKGFWINKKGQVISPGGKIILPKYLYLDEEGKIYGYTRKPLLDKYGEQLELIPGMAIYDEFGRPLYNMLVKDWGKPIPSTGAEGNTALWMGTCICSFFMLILLIFGPRKEENEA